MEQMEARFNAKFDNPYVFLNNSPFSAAFANRCVFTPPVPSAGFVRSPCSGARSLSQTTQESSNACDGVRLIIGILVTQTPQRTRRTSAATAAQTFYGEIPKEHWGYPEWISTEQAATARADMGRRGVLYGQRESYHHMCR